MKQRTIISGIALAAILGLLVFQAKYSLFSRAQPIDSKNAVSATPNRSEVVVWHSIETVSAEWLKGSEAYKFVVEEPTPGAGPDEENSRRLRIQIPGRPDYLLVVPGGLVAISDGLQDHAIATDNLLRSRYVYLSPRLKDVHDLPMLVVFGWAFASDPGSMNVLALEGSGYPVKVFDSETFELSNIIDLDGDGLFEIVGKHNLSEGLGRCIETYSPYSVYRLPQSSGVMASVSLPMTEAYNVEHYGWAGPDYREDIAVVDCDPGKPKIMSIEKARALYGN